jgi:L-ascorbate metabolism protein UlaG (beta-lactamase superfamily)
LKSKNKAMSTKQFGGKITKELIEKYQTSPHWQNDRFHNLETTTMDINLYKVPGIIYEQFFKKVEKVPSKSLPIADFDQSHFLAPSTEAKYVWYGHSVVLLRMNQQTILIDPMLGPDAAPIAPFSTKRFSPNTLNLIDDFPEIDLLILTHDHYDHLDYASINKLKHKTKNYFVALGVKRHLVSWGVDPGTITEFDWWDSQNFQDISISFTPTRHFSGRGLKDRAKSLWGGWVFQTGTENIWFSGDGGYGSHFEEIGEKFGHFDFAFMECGQYNENWHQIHMYPEESVKAALDTNVSMATPVHWGGFSLAPHAWDEPVERFSKEAGRLGLKTTFPQLGVIYTITDKANEPWWAL